MLGEELEVRHRRDPDHPARPRGLDAQEEPDGTILGISFFERIEEQPPGVELDSTSLEIAPGDLARQLGMTEGRAQTRADTDPDGPHHKPGTGHSRWRPRPSNPLVAHRERLAYRLTASERPRRGAPSPRGARDSPPGASGGLSPSGCGGGESTRLTPR